MIRYHFDLYPRDDPEGGTRLVRFTQLQAAKYRGEANGTGAGSFSIRATDSEAAFIDPKGLQYVRVVRDDGDTELVIGGFFIERGQFAILSGTSTKVLELGGTGPLAYFQRAVMDADSWLTDPFNGTDPQPDGTWPLHLAGTGNSLGAILWRVLRELQELGRHQNPVPAATLDFTYLLDSNGDPWVRTSGDFVAQVGESVFSIMQRLMQLGLYVEVDPHTFEVRAYEPETHRRDRTGGAFAVDVVRFQAGSNVKSDATRQLEASVQRNALLVGSQDSWLWVDNPAADVPWEGGYILDDESGTSLEAAGDAQIAARTDAGDTLLLRMLLGDAEVDGAYIPFEHVKVDDLVTVHTGTGQWDFDEQTFPVAALTLTLRQGGDWDCWVDLGSTYTSMAERAFQAQPVKAHNHPPNPKLCPPATEGIAASCAVDPSTLTPVATPNGDFEMGNGTNWSGASVVAGDPGAVGGSFFSTATIIGPGGWTYTGWSALTFLAGQTYIVRVFVGGTGAHELSFGVAGVDETYVLSADVVLNAINCVEWTPSADRTNVRFGHGIVGNGTLTTDNLQAYTGGSDTNPLNGISPMAARCDHEHEGITDHGDLTGLADNDHPQYLTEAEHTAIAHPELTEAEHDALDHSTLHDALDHMDLGHWEPVTNGDVGSPEIVFELGDVVMEWVA